MFKTPWARWGAVLGFALGGFFDTILLHQILQWHHLLSLVPGIDDLRLQVLWDGWFHALMYLIALAGLIGLWRLHRRGAGEWGWPLVGAVLVGFKSGTWSIPCSRTGCSASTASASTATIPWPGTCCGWSCSASRRCCSAGACGAAGEDRV